MAAAAAGASFFAPTLPISPAKPTLRQVILFTRHGARFPLHNFGSDQNWPKDEVFWDSYAGMLSPQGCAQMENLGRLLRKRYVESGALFGDDEINVGRQCYVYTTRTHRTVFSASAFLMGFLPRTHVHFSSAPDPTEETVEARDEPVDSVNIRLWLKAKRCHILQQAKKEKAYKAFKEKAMEGEKFTRWLQDPEVTAIVDKLWTMTGFNKLDPTKKAPEKRVKRLQTVETQIALEIANGMLPLRNDQGLVLAEGERAKIQEVASAIWRSKFQGQDHEAQHVGGRLGANNMIDACYRSMQTAADGTNPHRFVFYSAHDGSILALLARLGFANFAVPKFAASLILELHAPTEGQLEHHVEVYYAPDPMNVPFPAESIRLPAPGIVHDYADVRPGSSTLGQFEELVMHCVDMPEGGIKEEDSPSSG